MNITTSKKQDHPKTFHVVCAAVNHSMQYDVIASDDKTDKVKAAAVFQKLYTKNNNGHHMDEDCLIRELNSAQPSIRDRGFVGELDHPEDLENGARIASVQFKAASHVITKLGVEGNYVTGEFETLGTFNGQQLAALLRDKIKVGVSIRAITDQDIVYDGSSYQKIDDFHLICYDAVHNPAFNDAYVTGLLSSMYKLPPKVVNDLVHDKPSGELITLSKGELKELVTSMVASLIKVNYKRLK